MEKLLIFIKHHFATLWYIIEWSNGKLCSLMYKSRMDRTTIEVLDEFKDYSYSFRRLNVSDAKSICNMIQSQAPSDLKYFNPHRFDLSSIQKQLYKRAFLMMGAFEGDSLVGYFFLRFFANRRCFVGRIIDKPYRGKGIGIAMNQIMYNISWRMGFRCLSTISRNNSNVIAAHSKNPFMIVLKELQNDYLLVEFVKPAHAI